MGGAISPVGRTRTGPPANAAHPAPLLFAFVPLSEYGLVSGQALGIVFLGALGPGALSGLLFVWGRPVGVAVAVTGDPAVVTAFAKAPCRA